MTLSDFSDLIGKELNNIAHGKGMIMAKFSVDVEKPDATLQVTLRPKSILIEAVKTNKYV